jgi:hypothetical protein
MDIFGEEFSQMFSIVDGVREQALADSRMTDFAKSSVQTPGFCLVHSYS